jgi:hypothetical protein
MQISQEHSSVVTHFKHEAGEQDHELLTLKANQRHLSLYGTAIDGGTHLLSPGCPTS